jgi:hypothetical protein
MQERVAKFINDNGGSATIVEPFSERFDPTAMREEFGHFDVAQGLLLEDTTPSIVRPVVPNDRRARAARIGGLFAGRIGEALDLGLEPKALDALLDTLDASTTALQASSRSEPAAPPTGAGLAMAQSPPRKTRASAPPPKRSRQMDVGPTIAGVPVAQVTGHRGDVTWSLPQWTGVKHPNDRASATDAVYQDGVVALDQWPRLAADSEDVFAWFQVRWQYNGTSLGHICVEPKGSDNAAGHGLGVTGTIEDESQLYPRSATAAVSGPDQVPALHVAMKYVFGDGPGSHVATRRLTLYADGTHQIDSAWAQPGAPSPAASRDLAPA